jgi:hypothetical protein
MRWRGTMVVFPAPGRACRMVLVCLARAFERSGRIWMIGRGGNGMKDMIKKGAVRSSLNYDT